MPIHRLHRQVLLLCNLFIMIFALLAVDAKAQTPPESPVPLPVPFTPIVDNANVIDSRTRQELESIYRELKDQGKIEYAVVTVPTTGDQDIFDFSLAVARGWGIGAKDGDKASFLLVVAIQDRKYFTQVSRHLEGDLPDGLVGRIQRERLVPQFRQQNYSQGILDTIEAYVATLAQKRGFTIGDVDNGKAVQVEPRRAPRSNPQTSLSTFCAGAVIIFVILILLSSASRRGRGGGGGCLQALLWGSVFNSMSRGGGWGSSSGWGGGGFGGGGGGGGGFGGGGFGGGGDFGGGGAGGSW